MSDKDPNTRTRMPPFVKFALIGFAAIIVVQIFLRVPFLNEMFRRHQTAFVVGIPAILVGIWGVFLWRRRNTTPEFTREVLHWIFWAGGVIFLAFIAQN